MRIHIISDLHLDHHPDAFNPELPDCDIRIVVGDICELMNREQLAVPFLKSMSRAGAPVYFVLGNHDHYARANHPNSQSYAIRLAAWRDTCDVARVRLLERETVDIGNNFLLHGCTWWSALDWLEKGNHAHRDKFPDDQSYVHRVTEIGISDFRQIRKWSLEEHQKRHAEDTEWLEEKLNTTPKNKKNIVLTHFLPHRSAIHPVFKGSSLNAYFTTHRPDLVSKASLWIFGHTHHHVDTMAEGCRLVANPRGYPSENGGFVNGFVVEV